MEKEDEEDYIYTRVSTAIQVDGYSLNIAKTKRKCGIIERQNYNLPKSEGSRSPETPKEKEDAIIKAFRYFQMI